jgi:hypothetical protein
LGEISTASVLRLFLSASSPNSAPLSLGLAKGPAAAPFLTIQSLFWMASLNFSAAGSRLSDCS